VNYIVLSPITNSPYIVLSQLVIRFYSNMLLVLIFGTSFLVFLTCLDLIPNFLGKNLSLYMCIYMDMLNWIFPLSRSYCKVLGFLLDWKFVMQCKGWWERWRAPCIKSEAIISSQTAIKVILITLFCLIPFLKAFSA